MTILALVCLVLTLLCWITISLCCCAWLRYHDAVHPGLTRDLSAFAFGVMGLKQCRNTDGSNTCFLISYFVDNQGCDCGLFLGEGQCLGPLSLFCTKNRCVIIAADWFLCVRIVFFQSSLLFLGIPGKSTLCRCVSLVWMSLMSHSGKWNPQRRVC